MKDILSPHKDTLRNLEIESLAKFKLCKSVQAFQWKLSHCRGGVKIILKRENISFPEKKTGEKDTQE